MGTGECNAGVILRWTIMQYMAGAGGGGRGE